MGGALEEPRAANGHGDEGCEPLAALDVRCMNRYDYSRELWRAGTMKPIHVLLIEHQPEEARRISEMLGAPSAVAFQVEQADRLEKALLRLRQGNIDVALFDCAVPNGDGLDTFRAVRAAAGTVPILVLTGTRDMCHGAQAVQEGAHAYLVKGEIDGNSLVRHLPHGSSTPASGGRGVPFAHVPSGTAAVPASRPDHEPG